jgi:serine/threonine protein kinase/Tfp pilus assembly protein PilF
VDQTPSACPDPARLRRVLDDALSDAERRDMAAHLDACELCQARLDRWTEDPAVLAGAPGPDAVKAATSPSLEEVLDRLKHMPAPMAISTHRDESLAPRFRETTVPELDTIPLGFLAPSARPGGLGRLGAYEVLKVIGQGGMGVVLEALDERLNRTVAIKVLAPGLAGHAIARRRFLREARAAAAVCHEHVVTIHAVDDADGHPYLVMQLIAGQSLQAKIDRTGPLGVKEILRIGMQVAAGLTAAHAQGVIHRDIKPANLLLENGVERVKITDFGLAHVIDDASLTASGTTAGTPHYMSPEQARGEPVDHRSDLFSLGSVLYATCTGQPPFRADSAVAVLRKVSDESPRPVREQNPEIPDWLAALIGRLMAKDPADRFQSAGEVAEFLASHLAELQHPIRRKPAPAAPCVPSKPHRLRDFLAVLLGAVLAFTLLGWWIFGFGGSAQLAPSPLARRPADPSRADRPRAPSSITKPAAENVARDPEGAKVLYAQACEAANRGQYPRAVEQLTDAIRRDPENLAALLQRARVYNNLSVKNWAGAIADATEVIRRDPQNAAAYETRGSAEFRTGDTQRAIADFTETIRLDSGRSWAYASRGALYNGLGQWNRAILDLDEYLRRVPDVADSAWSWTWYQRAFAYLGLGDTDRALSDANRAIELSPNIDFYWTFRARVHTRKNDSERAIADYTAAIRLQGARGEPTDDGADTFAARGAVYLARGETDRAIADFDEAARLDPTPAEIHWNRGVAHARLGEWDRAIADFEEGRKRGGADKRWADACLQGRAECLALSGRHEAAEAAYRECVESDPGHTQPVLASRAWFLDRPRGDYDAALQKLGLAAEGWMIAPLLERGLIFVRLDMPDRALADFEEVMNRVKAQPDWLAAPDYLPRWLGLLLGRGEASMLKGNLDRALAAADAAVRFAPKSAEARLLRARVHEKRGKPQLAEADREAAAHLVPDPILALPKPRRAAGH